MLKSIADKKEIYFHVGLHKTASTFLQENVFPYFKDIQFIKKHNFRNRDEIIEKSDNIKFLISREMEPEKEKDMIRIQDIAIKYPDTRLILILRNHAGMIKSKYKYYLRKHGYKHFDDFFDLQNDTGIIKKENLDYGNKIQILKKYFTCPVFVMFQEEFINNPFAAIDQLAEYIHTEYNKKDIQLSRKNASFSEKQLKLIRKFNKLSPHDHSRIQSPFLRFGYRKFGDGLLYLVAYSAKVLPERLVGQESLIPDSKLHEINEFYKEDWNSCLRYAQLLRNQLYV